MKSSRPVNTEELLQLSGYLGSGRRLLKLFFAERRTSMRTHRHPQVLWLCYPLEANEPSESDADFRITYAEKDIAHLDPGMPLFYRYN